MRSGNLFETAKAFESKKNQYIALVGKASLSVTAPFTVADWRDKNLVNELNAAHRLVCNTSQTSMRGSLSASLAQLNDAITELENGKRAILDNIQSLMKRLDLRQSVEEYPDDVSISDLKAIYTALKTQIRLKNEQRLTSTPSINRRASTGSMNDRQEARPSSQPLPDVSPAARSAGASPAARSAGASPPPPAASSRGSSAVGWMFLATIQESTSDEESEDTPGTPSP